MTADEPMLDAEALLALVERLEQLLEQSDLLELEVESGGLGIRLRKPDPGARAVESVEAGGGGASAGAGGSARPGRSDASDASGARDPIDVSGATLGEESGSSPGAPGSAPPAPGTHAVLAPLTGIYYAAPSPDAAPYVRVGMEIVTGQVIGLIEAMKLFNEIKSDATGRVVRLHATDGALVKARQPLIEIEPTI